MKIKQIASSSLILIGCFHSQLSLSSAKRPCRLNLSQVLNMSEKIGRGRVVEATPRAFSTSTSNHHQTPFVDGWAKKI